MNQAYFITGTGTDIGKTVVTQFLVLLCNEFPLNCIPFKPIQTGCIKRDHQWIASDIDQYKPFTNHDSDEMGLYQFEPAVSPHLAAKITNTLISPDKIKNKLHQLREKYDVVFVEGAGGVAVPLVERNEQFWMTKDLIQDLQLPIILVAPAELGAIHHVLTTVMYATEHQLSILGIIFNQFDEGSIIHKDNVRTIEKVTNIPVLATIPAFKEELRSALPRFTRQFAQTNQGRKLIEVLTGEKHENS